METTMAAGVRGFILKSAIGDGYFFRVYNNDGSFTDFQLGHLDLEVEILSTDAALYFGEDANTLDYSPEVLGID